MTSIPVGLTAQGKRVDLELSMANRHGLIAGATGTGKTSTLQLLAEGFSKAGVPVVAADVKGDLSGLAMPSVLEGSLAERVQTLALPNFSPRGYPVMLWDPFGKRGQALRMTVSEVGPLIFSRLLGLNDTQDQVLNVAFQIADSQGLLLLDLKDLSELLKYLSEHLQTLKTDYGNLSPASVATIQRSVITLANAGGDKFFGEPAVKLEHLLQKDFSGNAVINLLDVTALMANGRLYSSFLLALLSQLFEGLPEVGDLALPKVVFFFDEAHLLFTDTPRELSQRIELMIRLIRSKDVGVFFVTQNPSDIPENILGQLSNRVQHALRAFTPKDEDTVKVAARTFRANPRIDTMAAITSLGVGEALVSNLAIDGTPTIVEQVKILPPESRRGSLTDMERASVLQRSPLAGTYDQVIDRESAYELLRERREAPAGALALNANPTMQSMVGVAEHLAKTVVTSAARSIGYSLGREIIRGVMGSILGSPPRRGR